MKNRFEIEIIIYKHNRFQIRFQERMISNRILFTLYRTKTQYFHNNLFQYNLHLLYFWKRFKKIGRIFFLSTSLIIILIVKIVGENSVLNIISKFEIKICITS